MESVVRHRAQCAKQSKQRAPVRVVVRPDGVGLDPDRNRDDAVSGRPFAAVPINLTVWPIAADCLRHSVQQFGKAWGFDSAVLDSLYADTLGTTTATSAYSRFMCDYHTPAEALASGYAVHSGNYGRSGCGAIHGPFCLPRVRLPVQLHEADEPIRQDRRGPQSMARERGTFGALTMRSGSKFDAHAGAGAGDWLIQCWNPSIHVPVSLSANVVIRPEQGMI